MDLELRHLRLVAAIAETGSVTRAGERLHLTQSALSHQLRDIESRLDAALFHRVGKRMVVTAAGEQVLRSATQVLAIVAQTEDDIKRVARGREGQLRLSTECYTCYHWLPAVLKSYRATHPKVDVQIDVNSTRRPLTALLDGRLDLAVVSSRVADRRLTARPLFDDDMFVIMTPGHRLASRRYVKPQDFVDETLLLYTPIEESTVYQRVLVPAGVVPASIQHVQLTEAIIELAKAGLGIAVLAGWAIAPYVRAGTLKAVPLTRRGYRRQWKAVTLRDMAGVPYVRDFIDLLSAQSPVGRSARGGLELVRFASPESLREWFSSL